MTLIERYGLPHVAGVVAVLLIVLYYASTLGLAKAKAWYYERKVERVTDQRDKAMGERDVARKDEVQVTRSAGITATTVAAQDQHATAQRDATKNNVEDIRERILKVPVVVLVPDDPVVRQRVQEAVVRAQAAQARLRGTQSN